MSSFTDLGLAPDLVAALAARGITEPFPVQAATIPDALAGRDVMRPCPDGLRQDDRLRRADSSTASSRRVRAGRVR